MSTIIDDLSTYLNSIEAVSSLTNQSASAESVTKETTGTSDRDSYISSVGDTDKVLVSDTYNDIISSIKAAAAQASESSDSESGQTSASGSSSASGTASASGSAGGSGSSSEESETETEIVTINGITYLQTTTTSGGIETVTRVALSEASAADRQPQDGTAAAESASAGAKAL